MKTMRMKIALFAGLVFALAISPVYAAPVTIDLSSVGGTDLGTLTYTGGATPLVGANILINNVSGVNTPSNAGVADAITSGILSFTTGNFVSFSGGTYTFGAGGSITITGTGPGCTTVGGCGGNTPNTTSGPTLLSGTPLTATYTGGTLNLYITSGTDTKDPKLVQFFGFNPAQIPGGWAFSGTVHAALTSGGTGGAFTAASLDSTDISNTPLPEPASILLIGAGLLGFGLVLRKKQIQSVN
jgi:hypothetical protein